MKKLYLTLSFVLISFTGICQIPNESVLYIVDSVPIYNEPPEGFDSLDENLIDRVDIVRNKETIEKAGYKDLEGLIYVYTKEYTARPDSIKAIPTTKLMTAKNGVWYLQSQTEPYTGSFIDYYLNGKKQGEGSMLNGKLNGERKLYYTDGQISDFMVYENGIPSGMEKRFYQDGNIMQKGEFKNGIEIGVWEMYHPNGQLKQRANFIDGKMDGEAISYYSTGEIKGINIYKNGDWETDKTDKQLFKLYMESQELSKRADYKSAIRRLDKALKLKDNWADAYFARGTMKLNNLQYDKAIEDFNKTLEIEPYFTHAYANRAFALLRKHELGEVQELSKSKGFQVVISKDSQIPAADLKSICSDLNKAVKLGDDNQMVLEALEKNCEK